MIIIPKSPVPFEDLPLEKQLSHHNFKSEIRHLSLTEAQQLLEALHQLYLGQSTLIEKFSKVKLR